MSWVIGQGHIQAQKLRGSGLFRLVCVLGGGGLGDGIGFPPGRQGLSPPGYSYSAPTHPVLGTSKLGLELPPPRLQQRSTQSLVLMACPSPSQLQKVGPCGVGVREGQVRVGGPSGPLVDPGNSTPPPAVFQKRNLKSTVVSVQPGPLTSAHAAWGPSGPQVRGEVGMCTCDGHQNKE